MGSNKTDVDDPVSIVDLHHQAVLIPTDVEAHTAILKDAGTNVVPFYRRRRNPIRRASELEPRSQGLLGVSMFFPECPEGPARNDPHGTIYLAPKLGSRTLFSIWEQFKRWQLILTPRNRHRAKRPETISTAPIQTRHVGRIVKQLATSARLEHEWVEALSSRSMRVALE